MIKEYRKNIECYLAAMLLAKKMLSIGIIGSEEYKKVDELMATKYCIKRCSIYRLNNLIDSSIRGNIVDNQEDK